MPSLNQCSFLYTIRKSAPQMHLLMQCWLLNTPKEPDLRWPCTYALPSYLSSLPRRALLSASLPWSITPCAASSAVPLDAPTHKGPATVLRQSDNTAAELRRSPCHLCSGSDRKLLLILKHCNVAMIDMNSGSELSKMSTITHKNKCRVIPLSLSCICICHCLCISVTSLSGITI